MAQQRRRGPNPKLPEEQAGRCARFFVFRDHMTDLIAKTAIDRRLADIVQPVIEG